MRYWLFAASLAPACTSGAVTDVNDSVNTPFDSNETESVEPLNGFSWVIPDSLAGMPLPGQYATLENDLLYMKEQGLSFLVSLTESPLDPDQVTAHGIEHLHIPIEDFTAPEQDQIDQFIDELSGRLGHGEQVGVHCHGGLGRTGTMLSTWFVVQGMTADEAMAHVRALRPGSIETEEQEDAVRRFEGRLRP